MGPQIFPGPLSWSLNHPIFGSIAKAEESEFRCLWNGGIPNLQMLYIGLHSSHNSHSSHIIQNRSKKTSWNMAEQSFTCFSPQLSLHIEKNMEKKTLGRFPSCHVGVPLNHHPASRFWIFTESSCWLKPGGAGCEARVWPCRLAHQAGSSPYAFTKQSIWWWIRRGWSHYQGL